MNIFIVFFTFAVWAWSFPLGKWAGDTGSILLVTSVRQLLAAAILFLFFAFSKRKLKLPTVTQLKGLLILGIFGFYITNYLELLGLSTISSSRASLIYGLSPFIAAILSYIKLKEKISAQKFLGLLVGFLAFLPIIMDIGRGGFSFDVSIGDLALVGATAFAMYGWVVLRDLVKEQKMDPIGANAWAMLFGGLACFIHSIFSDVWNPIPIFNPTAFIASISILVVISNLICSNLYSFLLKKYTVTFLSLAGMSTPFFATAWGWMFLGETFDVRNIFSAVLMALGLWIVYREECRLESLNLA